MRAVTKLAAIPEGSVILDGFGEVHFHDTGQIFARTDRNIGEVADEIMTLPAWVVLLFRLRNAIVGCFGLKTGDDASFPIISQAENEVVKGLGDSHLDFRVSFMKDPARGTISLTTVVHFNNVWGRVYFFPVKPFHKIIMKALLRRYLKSGGGPETE
jgi:hypothetical protein